MIGFFNDLQGEWNDLEGKVAILDGPETPGCREEVAKTSAISGGHRRELSIVSQFGQIIEPLVGGRILIQGGLISSNSI